MLHTARIETRFEAAHRLHSHAGHCVNIHGHSYRVVWHLSCSELNGAGMVLDFAQIKKCANNVTDYFDHSLILDVKDPIFPVLKLLSYNPTSINLIGVSKEPTAEHFSKVFAKKFYTELTRMVHPSNVWLSAIEVYETESCSTTLFLTQEEYKALGTDTK